MFSSSLFSLVHAVTRALYRLFGRDILSLGPDDAALVFKQGESIPVAPTGTGDTAREAALLLGFHRFLNHREGEEAMMIASRAYLQHLTSPDKGPESSHPQDETIRRTPWPQKPAHGSDT